MALLRLSYGSIKALLSRVQSRRSLSHEGSIKALLRLYEGSIKALLRFY
jgi:hypothetical protein